MRDQHYASVEAAKQKIGELQEHIAAATNAAEEAINAVAVATGGEQCNSASGQGAFSRISRTTELLRDVYATTSEAVTELEAYQGDL